MDKKQELFVSQIQRFSLHDGPGIRTTIFLKGCNLRCKWCHNPETQNLIPEIQYLENRCRKCASCAMTCPQKALTIKPEGWSLDKEHCNNCMICVSNCYANALQISGSYEASEELVAQAKRDQRIFGEGGVTFSGGEPMLQIDILEYALKEAKKQKLHTAVDTAGNVPWDFFERIIPYTDLFLFDIKGMKPEVHKQYTGVDNTRILENIKKLSFEKDTRIWIRMPLVEGVNASENDIDDFLAFYLQLGSIDRIDLLPYHSYGTYKAKSLQMPEEVFETPSPEKMERIRMKIKTVNENVFVM